VRVVVDTNVLVSALRSPAGTCARVVALVLSGDVVVAYDERDLAEHREVLARPRLGIDPREARRLLDFIVEAGAAVAEGEMATTERCPDPDDLPFIEVARAARADALVTGNRRHFREAGAMPVLSPTELMHTLAAASGP
jgi:putative PIN family toxin of toxin-antitoxin system